MFRIYTLDDQKIKRKEFWDWKLCFYWKSELSQSFFFMTSCQNCFWSFICVCWIWESLFWTNVFFCKFALITYIVIKIGKNASRDIWNSALSPALPNPSQLRWWYSWKGSDRSSSFAPGWTPCSFWVPSNWWFLWSYVCCSAPVSGGSWALLKHSHAVWHKWKSCGELTAAPSLAATICEDNSFETQEWITGCALGSGREEHARSIHGENRPVAWRSPTPVLCALFQQLVCIMEKWTHQLLWAFIDLLPLL